MICGLSSRVEGGVKFRFYQIKCTQTFDPKFKMLLNSTRRKISIHICKDSFKTLNSNIVHLNYRLIIVSTCFLLLQKSKIRLWEIKTVDLSKRESDKI